MFRTYLNQRAFQFNMREAGTPVDRCENPLRQLLNLLRGAGWLADDKLPRKHGQSCVDLRGNAMPRDRPRMGNTIRMHGGRPCSGCARHPHHRRIR